MKRILLIILIFSACQTATIQGEDPVVVEAIDTEAKQLYQQHLATLGQRMQWWEDARFGMFIHWGPSAHLGGIRKGKTIGGYSEHIMRVAKMTNDEYLEEAVKPFNPEKFDADNWVLQCKNAGMRYMVITAKHHDGFAMWHSKNPYNIVDATSFKRDPLKELRDACQRHGIHFGVYYSHAQDWHHPGGQINKQTFPWHPMTKHWWERPDEYPGQFARTRQYMDEKSIPQLLEIIDQLHPELIWFDTCDWIPPLERNRLYLACRKADPNLIISGRIGNNLQDYQSTCDTPAALPPTDLQYWEAIPTTNNSYGYHAKDLTHKPTSHFIDLLIQATSKGGNMLLNIGPKGDGTIDAPDQSILAGIGTWMKTNHASIYGCGATPLPAQNWGYTTQPTDTATKRLYLHIKEWPTDNHLIVAGLDQVPTQITALASPIQKFTTSQLSSGHLCIQLPSKPLQTPFTTLQLDFNAPVTVTNTSRILHANTKANVLHVFDDAILKGDLEYGDGLQNNQSIESWIRPDQSVSWNLFTTEQTTWTIKIHYQCLHFKTPWQKRLEQPYLEKLKQIMAHITIDGKTYDKKLAIDNLEKDGHAMDTVVTLTLPAGPHSLTVTAEGMQPKVPFRLRAVNLEPVAKL